MPFAFVNMRRTSFSVRVVTAALVSESRSRCTRTGTMRYSSNGRGAAAFAEAAASVLGFSTSWLARAVPNHAHNRSAHPNAATVSRLVIALLHRTKRGNVG